VVRDGWEIITDPFTDGAEDVCACLWMILRDLEQWVSAARLDGLFGNRTHKTRARMLRVMRTAPALAPALRVFLRLRADPAAFRPQS
jgi:hypothetical protein